MNDKLSEEFDHFKKRAIDAYLYPVEVIELLGVLVRIQWHWY